MTREPAGDGAVERIRRRDELLQVLFWLEGEGFETEMTAAGVRRFLRWPAREVRRGLEELVEDGFAVELRGAGAPGREAGGPAALRLTDAGRQEGGRRFVAEFAALLSRDTHHGGECHDPECECHELGPAACTNAPSRAG